MEKDELKIKARYLDVYLKRLVDYKVTKEYNELSAHEKDLITIEISLLVMLSDILQRRLKIMGSRDFFRRNIEAFKNV